MKRLLVFVTLLAVTGVVYAQTRTECSDRAYLIFQECLEFEEEMKAFNKDDSDLYSSWEMRSIGKQAETCLHFYRNKSRYQSCSGRLIDEAIEQAIEKTIQEMDPKERKELEESGPATLPPHEGSDSPLHFASELEARMYTIELILRKTLKDMLDEMQRK